MDFQCESCGKKFKHKSTLKHHIESTHQESVMFFCEKCSKLFQRKDIYNRYVNTCKNKKDISLQSWHLLEDVYKKFKYEGTQEKSS